MRRGGLAGCGGIVHDVIVGWATPEMLAFQETTHEGEESTLLLRLVLAVLDRMYARLSASLLGDIARYCAVT